MVSHGIHGTHRIPAGCYLFHADGADFRGLCFNLSTWLHRLNGLAMQGDIQWNLFNLLIFYISTRLYGIYRTMRSGLFHADGADFRGSRAEQILWSSVCETIILTKEQKNIFFCSRKDAKGAEIYGHTENTEGHRIFRQKYWIGAPKMRVKITIFQTPVFQLFISLLYRRT